MRGHVRKLGAPNGADRRRRLRPALVMAILGEIDTALNTALEAEKISREHLRLTSSTLPEKQALRYAAARPRIQDLLLTLALNVLDAS